MEEKPRRRFSSWKGSASPSQFLTRWAWAAFFGVLFLTVIALSFAYPLFKELGLTLSLLLSFGFVSSLKRLPSSVRRMKDLPEAVPQYSAKVTYSTMGSDGTSILGSDVGLLSFVDHTLYFEGQRTRFSLDSWHVDAKLMGSNVKGTYSQSEIGILLSGGPAQYSMTWVSGVYQGGLEIRFFDETQGRLHQFAGEYADWLIDHDPVDGETLYPPIGPDPQLFLEMRTAVALFNRLMLVASLPIMGLLLWETWASSVWTSPTVVLSLLVFVGNRLAHRRLNNLGHAARVEESAQITEAHETRLGFNASTPDLMGRSISQIPSKEGFS